MYYTIYSLNEILSRANPRWVKRDGNYIMNEAISFDIETSNFKNENGVEITRGKYPVKVYAVQNDRVLKTQELMPVWEGVWMNYDQSVHLPEGTTAVAVRFENLEEDIKGSVWIDVG